MMNSSKTVTMLAHVCAAFVVMTFAVGFVADGVAASWQENVRPKMYVQLGKCRKSIFIFLLNLGNYNVGGNLLLFFYFLFFCFVLFFVLWCFLLRAGMVVDYILRPFFLSPSLRRHFWTFSVSLFIFGPFKLQAQRVRTRRQFILGCLFSLFACAPCYLFLKQIKLYSHLVHKLNNLKTALVVTRASCFK